ncbi:efflux RND transporter periplasmic adaptor subunit [bacterium]|nr:MAG: efflux RND transporter periplasmic adaptor subunit [bacterium]
MTKFMSKKRIRKILKFALKYKFWTILILALIVASCFFLSKNITQGGDEITYVTETAKKGNLIQSVSGTGQISSLNDLDLKTQASGKVVYVGAKNGQKVKAGQLILQIDLSDALKAISDAETNLETAQLSLEKFLQPADAFSILQAENNLIDAEQNKIDAEKSLEDTYEDAYNTIVDVFLGLPTVISGLNNALYGYDISESTIMLSNYSQNEATLISTVLSPFQDEIESLAKTAEDNYSATRTLYNSNFANYEATSRYSDKETIENLLNETITTIKSMSETVKSDVNLFNYWVDYRSKRNQTVFSQITSWQSSLKSYMSTTNNYLSSLLSTQRSVASQKKAIPQAIRSIQEKTESLAKLNAEPDELDLRSQKLNIAQKENVLSDAKKALADYYVYSPVGGTIANMDIRKEDTVSNNASVATLISDQKIAKISLNEIDVANIEIGQKASITIDAIDDLSVSGEVMEIDSVGTVSQNVVSYGVKIALDTQDERIKSGMSMSVSIITNMAQNSIIIKNSALKESNTGAYIEILKNGQPTQVNVETGLSNDTMTEITSGLQEGDEVITQSKTNGASSSAPSSVSGSIMPMGGGGEGVQRDMMRIMR